MSNVDRIRETSKNAYLNIRISEQQKEIISRAASLRNLSLSEFVIENASDAAYQVLAEKTQFVLPPEQWEAFCEALDAPPKDIPALRELFSKPSVFDES